MMIEMTIEVVKRAIKSRVSIDQIAESYGVAPNTVRRLIKKEDPSLLDAAKEAAMDRRRERNRRNMEKLREAQRTMERNRERVKREAELKRLMDSFVTITDKSERFESMYASALLMFERKQARVGNRSTLPCDNKTKKDYEEKQNGRT